MDLIYTVNRKQPKRSQFSDNSTYVDDGIEYLIRVSSCSIVAWVCRYDLSELGNIADGSRIYVCELNTPWDYFKVTSNPGIITALEWDSCGEHLLIADNAGLVAIWKCNNYLINDWVCIGTANLPGEHILSGIFFHYGRKMSLISEKKDMTMYYDKFSHVPFLATLRAKGGTPIEGCLIITATGLIITLIISTEKRNQVTTIMDSIACTRYKITVVDLCYNKNGHLMVVTSNGSVNMPVKCYDIGLQYINEKTTIVKSQPMSGFFLDGVTSTDVSNQRIAFIKFALREAADCVVVITNGKLGGTLQVWELVDGPYRFNNLFGDPPVISDGIQSFSWQCQNAINLDCVAIGISTPKLLVTNAQPPMFNIVVAFKNNNIRVFTRNLKEEGVFNFNNHWDTTDIKRITNLVTISDMDVTLLGNMFIILDTLGNIYLFQLRNISEIGGPMTMPFAVAQLEYCLVTGYDWWDLALTMKPNMLETVSERFTENFLKQPQFVQQFEYCSYLRIKTSISRMLGNGQVKCNDYMYLMTLHAISVAFKSSLRPTDLPSSDKGPGETVAMALSDSVTDVDTVLMSLEPKEFTVEQSTLQSLQFQIQWVAHLALNILARLSEHRKTPGYDIVTDVQALNTLRELLVIVRIWGLLRPSCLPKFIRNVDNFDGISTLFRLISRLVQCNQNNDLEDSLIDDCCLLQNQVVIPMLSSVPHEMCNIASPVFYRQPMPFKFVFGDDPESFIYEIDTLSVDGAIHMTQSSDIIRHIYLGEHPRLYKQCTRCEGKTLTASIAKTAAAKAWENRWVAKCICGGKWKLVKKNSPPYSRKFVISRIMPAK